MSECSVSLVSYSQPSIELTDNADWNITDLVAYCARVSNPENQNNRETNEKLLNYLIKHKHWSPFEMVSICLHINSPRDIGRQILRHRSFSFQEFSQRYAKASNFVLREGRLQDFKNRQNSIEMNDDELQKEWREKQQKVILIDFRSNKYNSNDNEEVNE